MIPIDYVYRRLEELPYYAELKTTLRTGFSGIPAYPVTKVGLKSHRKGGLNFGS
jgi:hypothetical protein